jgi:hypothetical protein
VPYKNRDVGRAYDRLYKQERRRAASVFARRPIEPRAYICHRHPNFRLPGGISFHEGILVTADPAVQDAVEQSPEFGPVIFRVALVP